MLKSRVGDSEPLALPQLLRQSSDSESGGLGDGSKSRGDSASGRSRKVVGEWAPQPVGAAGTCMPMLGAKRLASSWLE